MARSINAMLVAGLLISLVLTSPANAAVTCSDVLNSVITCYPYIRNGGVGMPLPTCCAGVRRLNSMAVTTLDRQAACRCLKDLSSGMRTVNPSAISGLPGKCQVNVPYAITPKTNCNSIR